MAQQIKTKLLGAKRILLTTHADPDGDALGSMLGLYGALVSQWGKCVTMAASGESPVTFSYSYLPYFFKVQDSFEPQDYDTVVVLDCDGWARTGWFADNELKISWPDELIVIDHHQAGGPISGLGYINTAVSSTSEMIYGLLRSWGTTITKEIATCLLTGISFDTGSFQHPNTSQITLEIAADLTTRGGDLALIAQRLYIGKSVERLKLWGIVLQRMRYDDELKATISVITNKDLESTGTTKEDVEGLVNLINTVPDLNFSLLLSETPEGGVKGSLRTQSDVVDVNRLARWMGGGGHTRAAGFSLPAKLKNHNNRWDID